jgi:hypothetical protein
MKLKSEMGKIENSIVRENFWITLDGFRGSEKMASKTRWRNVACGEGYPVS